MTASTNLHELRPATRALMASAGLTLAGLGGCYAPTGEAPASERAVASTQAELQLYPAATRWPSHVKLCFTPYRWPQSEWIKDALRSSWQANSQIEFEFIDDCPATITEPMIQMNLVNSYIDKDTMMEVPILNDGQIGGGSGVGMGPNGQTVTMGVCHPTATQCPNEEEIVRATATHEVGHSLGFSHEHQRVDSPYITGPEQNGSYPTDWSGWCNPGPSPDPAGVATNWAGVSGWELTTYDPLSIMNYCRDMNFNQYSDRSEASAFGVDLAVLSSRDKDGIQAAYGFPDQQDTAAPLDCGAGNRLYTGDFTGDGISDYMCKSATTLTVKSGVSPATFALNTTWCTGPNADLLIGDLNGDARDDLLCVTPTGLSADYASIFFPFLFGSINWQNPFWVRQAGVQYHLGQMDGVGGLDIVRIDLNLDAINVDRAGTLLDWAGFFPLAPCLSEAGAVTRVADVTGDNLDDIVCQGNAADHSWYAYSTTLLGSWDFLFPRVLPSLYDMFGDLALADATLGDFDADGRTDFLYRRQGALALRFGLSFLFPPLDTDWSNSNSDFSGPAGDICDFADGGLLALRLNNDARDDFACHSADFSQYTRVVTPATFHAW